MINLLLRRTCLIAAMVLGAGSYDATVAQDQELNSPKLRIEWAEFKKLYDAKKIEVIDVRGEEAFELGHIPGARSVPLPQVESRADTLAKLKKPIVAYCA